jgi:hypothetical protein
MKPGWIIAACELRIPRRSGFAAHRMLVVADPAGLAVRQINGLASWWDRAGACWRHKPIGYLPSDRLRGYDTASHPRTFMPIHGCAPRSRDLRPALETGCASVLADGLGHEEAGARLAPALEAMRRVNALTPGPEGGAGLPYPWMGFGRNSNSFFSTMVAAMGFSEPRFARPAAFNPGQGRLLLPAAEIAALAQGCSAASTSGDRKSASG